MRHSLIAIYATLVFSGPALAEILYYHNFDGDASPLANVAPDVANTGVILGVDHGSSAVNWAETGVNQDGTFDGASSPTYAALPLDPVDGFIYTLQFTGTLSGNGTPWLGGGFINRPDTSQTFSYSPILYGITRPGSTDTIKQLAHFDSYGRFSVTTTSTISRIGTANNPVSPSTITIVLNTTEGSGGWDARWFVNGTLFATKTDMGPIAEDNILGVGFAGFTVSDIQSFSLEVAVAPLTIQSMTPLGNGIYPGANLVATFSENIALADTGTITLTDTNDGSGTRIINLPDPAQLSVSGNSLTINPNTALELGANYEVVISPGSIRRSSSTVSPFTGTTASQWTFRTSDPDTTAPVMTTKSPPDGSLLVPYNSNIVATFDENIVIGSGTITLKNLTNPSRGRIISITDASQVTISGNVLTIDPSFPLDADSDYAVQFSAGIILNYAELPCAGIPESDVTSWNFQTGPPSVVDIFVAYTPNTLAYHGTEAGMMAHIQACIAGTNNAYAQSGVTGQLRLVGTKLVNYTESTSNYTLDYDRLQNTSDGHLDEIHSLRNETGADLVCLLRKGNVSGVWGVAKIPLSTSGSHDLGFSIVSTEAALAIHAFAHELGHNMGLGHGKGDDNTYGLFPDSHGHRFNGLSGTQYRTIMSYTPGTQTGRFSNPALTFDGVATGVGPPSAGNSANAARTLSIMMPVIAGYRAAGTWLGVSGNWNEPAVWTDGSFVDGIDAFANFVGTNITADKIITLNGNRTVSNIRFTDDGVSSHNLTLTGSTLTFDVRSGTPSINVTQADRTLTIASAVAGGDGIQKAGSGRVTLSGGSSYTGNITVQAGIMQFAKTSSLYNAATSNWTRSKIIVNSGGTIAFNVGGTNEFTTGNVTTLLTNLGTSLNNNGLRAGSAIAFDTTNASGGSFTVSNVIANTTGTGGGALGLRKLGTNTLVLSNSSTYTGPTFVEQGALSVTGSLGATAVSVNSGTLSGNGNFGGNVTIAAAATHSLAVAATPAGQDTSVITGALAMSGSTFNLTAASAPAAGVYVLATAAGGVTGAPASIQYNGIKGTVSVDTTSIPNRLLLTITPYDSWSVTNASTGNPDDDFDNDGVPNVIEFVLGGTASTRDLAKLPTVATAGTNMTFSFLRNRDSVHPSHTVAIETGTTLTAWPNVYTVGADTATSSTGITVTNHGNGTDTVTLSVPQASDTVKFARLKVTVP